LRVRPGLRGRPRVLAGSAIDRFSNVPTTLDYLFGAEFTEPGDDNALVQEFVDASRANPELATVLKDAYADLRAEIDAALELDSPGGDPIDRDRAAYGILCLALGNVFIADLDVITARSGLIRFSADAIVSEYRHRTTVAAAHGRPSR
jgi:TetR/AcrR family transcriptional regulator, transcriptional repressor of bet genes